MYYLMVHLTIIPAISFSHCSTFSNETNFNFSAANVNNTSLCDFTSLSPSVEDDVTSSCTNMKDIRFFNLKKRLTYY